MFIPPPPVVKRVARLDSPKAAGAEGETAWAEPFARCYGAQEGLRALPGRFRLKTHWNGLQSGNITQRVLVWAQDRAAGISPAALLVPGSGNASGSAL